MHSFIIAGGDLRPSTATAGALRTWTSPFAPRLKAPELYESITMAASSGDVQL